MKAAAHPPLVIVQSGRGNGVDPGLARRDPQ